MTRADARVEIGSDLWGKTSDGWFAIRYQGSTYAKKA